MDMKSLLQLNFTFRSNFFNLGYNFFNLNYRLNFFEPRL